MNDEQAEKTMEERARLLMVSFSTCSVKLAWSGNSATETELANVAHNASVMICIKHYV